MAEKEYIEKRKLIEAWEREIEDATDLRDAFDFALEDVPAADVLEVVRCKDCEHYFCDTPYCKKHKVGYCAFDEIVKDKNHFCSYGERKEATP